MNRYDVNRRLGSRDEAVMATDRRWVDDMAEAAEHWVADLFMVRRPGSLGPDEGYDLVIGGRRVDVKWTQTVPGRNYVHLFVPAWKPLRADIYALVFGLKAGDFSAFAWADGWATREEVEAAPVREFGRKRASSGLPAPVHAIGFDRLHPLVPAGINCRNGDPRTLWAETWGAA